MPIIRDIIGNAFFKEKKNPNYDPLKGDGPDNLPYIQPGIGTRVWNPSGAEYATSVNRQAELMPAERAAQMQMFKDRTQFLEGQQEAEKIKGLKERDLTIASIMQNNPWMAQAFQSLTTTPAQNAIDLATMGINSPTEIAAQQGSSADIAGGIPALQSKGRGLATQTDIAKNEAALKYKTADWDAFRSANVGEKEGRAAVAANLLGTPETQAAAQDAGSRFDLLNAGSLMSLLPQQTEASRLKLGNQIINERDIVPQERQLATQQRGLASTQTAVQQGLADVDYNNLGAMQRSRGNQIRNDEFVSQYDPRVTSIAGNDRLPMFGDDGGVTLQRNPQYVSQAMKDMQENQDMMAAMGGGKFGGLAAAIGAKKVGQPAIPFRPTPGNTHTNLGGGVSNGVPVVGAPTATQAAVAAEKAKKKKDKIRMAYAQLQMEPMDTIGDSRIPASAAVPIMNFIEKPAGIPWQRDPNKRQVWDGKQWIWK